ncbi:hypothetical protein BGZ63DRAFT_440167, partial [Mariannaea sp. PMI_226]
GSQYLCFQPNERRRYTSRRTFPLIWLGETKWLKSMVVFVQESDKFYMRRKHETQGVVNYMKKKTIRQPNYRMFRSLRTLQGLDYIHMLRGMERIEFIDYDRGRDNRAPIRDFTFTMDVNNAVCRPKTEVEDMQSKLENLAPIVRGYVPEEEIILAVGDATRRVNPYNTRGRRRNVPQRSESTVEDGSDSSEDGSDDSSGSPTASKTTSESDPESDDDPAHHERKNTGGVDVGDGDDDDEDGDEESDNDTDDDSGDDTINDSNQDCVILHTRTRGVTTSASQGQMGIAFDFEVDNRFSGQCSRHNASHRTVIDLTNDSGEAGSQTVLQEQNAGPEESLFVADDLASPQQEESFVKIEDPDLTGSGVSPTASWVISAGDGSLSPPAITHARRRSSITPSGVNDVESSLFASPTPYNSIVLPSRVSQDDGNTQGQSPEVEGSSSLAAFPRQRSPLKRFWSETSPEDGGEH